MADQDAYNELSFYTLAHPSVEFIHQYIVDAYAAQHADGLSKPIYLDFALAGLYLHNEKGYSGKEVQQAHVELAKHKERLPRLVPIDTAGAMTVYDVIAVPAGAERDNAIRAWSASVWRAYARLHQQVKVWIDAELNLD
ncbi:hypothetical protein KGO95_03415 [Patescibacteria group bacterium]|nr:hypothetical protein [Patescibacteria group bacterium]